MFRKVISFASVCLLMYATSAIALTRPKVDLADGPQITVMTRNLYLGADLERLLTAAPEDIPNQGAEVFRIIQKTDFPARARAVAAEVEATGADLIGLQEAMLFRRQFPANPSAPAMEVVYDFVEILRGELQARGLHYTAAAVRTGFDAELPIATGEEIRITFRDVVLARAGLTINASQTGDFRSRFIRPTGFGLLDLRRGWALVDATIGGRSFRFVTAHLEQLHSGIQLAQANELLAGPLRTDLPVVFVGDFNDETFFQQTATYAHITAAGFADAWAVGGSGPGFTCCQQEDLRNATSQLTSRIDLVFFDGHFRFIGVDIVGENPADRLESAAAGGEIWPSDHAGVVARLELN